MRASKVKAKLNRNEPVLITQLHLSDASLFEMTSLMGFDCIWMDLEHHSHNLETANAFMRAIRVGSSDAIVRPGKGEFMQIGRLLEAGANGILYPRCSTADEAAEVVKWSKFAPLGERGYDGSGPDNPFRFLPPAEYLKRANEETFIVIQIEEPQAIEHLDEIFSVEGVDAVMLGPADFSVLSGIPGQTDHELVQEATREIAEAAKRAGKHWGRTSGSFDSTKEYLDLGARLIFQGSDIMTMKSALFALQEGAEKLGFTFEKSNHR